MILKLNIENDRLQFIMRRLTRYVILQISKMIRNKILTHDIVHDSNYRLYLIFDIIEHIFLTPTPCYRKNRFFRYLQLMFIDFDSRSRNIFLSLTDWMIRPSWRTKIRRQSYANWWDYDMMTHFRFRYVDGSLKVLTTMLECNDNNSYCFTFNYERRRITDAFIENLVQIQSNFLFLKQSILE